MQSSSPARPATASASHPRSGSAITGSHGSIHYFNVPAATHPSYSPTDSPLPPPQPEQPPLLPLSLSAYNGAAASAAAPSYPSTSPRRQPATPAGQCSAEAAGTSVDDLGQQPQQLNLPSRSAVGPPDTLCLEQLVQPCEPAAQQEVKSDACAAPLPAPVSVTVGPQAFRQQAKKRTRDAAQQQRWGSGDGEDSDFKQKRAGRGAGRQVQRDAEGGEDRPTVYGVFHPSRYMSGVDCILADGVFVSRSKFEKLGGSLMAKWYRSIRVIDTAEPLGLWLERHGLPVFTGKARQRRQRSNANLIDGGSDVEPGNGAGGASTHANKDALEAAAHAAAVTSASAVPGQCGGGGGGDSSAAGRRAAEVASASPSQSQVQHSPTKRLGRPPLKVRRMSGAAAADGAGGAGPAARQAMAPAEAPSAPALPAAQSLLAATTSGFVHQLHHPSPFAAAGAGMLSSSAAAAAAAPAAVGGKGSAHEPQQPSALAAVRSAIFGSAAATSVSAKGLGVGAATVGDVQASGVMPRGVVAPGVYIIGGKGAAASGPPATSHPLKPRLQQQQQQQQQQRQQHNDQPEPACLVSCLRPGAGGCGSQASSPAAAQGVPAPTPAPAPMSSEAAPGSTPWRVGPDSCAAACPTAAPPPLAAVVAPSSTVAAPANPAADAAAGPGPYQQAPQLRTAGSYPGHMREQATLGPDPVTGARSDPGAAEASSCQLEASLESAPATAAVTTGRRGSSCTSAMGSAGMMPRGSSPSGEPEPARGHYWGVDEWPSPYGMLPPQHYYLHQHQHQFPQQPPGGGVQPAQMVSPPAHWVPRARPPQPRPAASPFMPLQSSQSQSPQKGRLLAPRPLQEFNAAPGQTHTYAPPGFNGPCAGVPTAAPPAPTGNPPSVAPGCSQAHTPPQTGAQYPPGHPGPAHNQYWPYHPYPGPSRPGFSARQPVTAAAGARPYYRNPYALEAPVGASMPPQPPLPYGYYYAHPYYRRPPPGVYRRPYAAPGPAGLEPPPAAYGYQCLPTGMYEPYGPRPGHDGPPDARMAAAAALRMPPTAAAAAAENICTQGTAAAAVAGAPEVPKRMRGGSAGGAGPHLDAGAAARGAPWALPPPAARPQPGQVQALRKEPEATATSAGPVQGSDTAEAAAGSGSGGVGWALPNPGGTATGNGGLGGGNVEFAIDAAWFSESWDLEEADRAMQQMAA
uniref:RlsE n=1 Tax=Yamagishiella unicocca TaxID=51707 RepID=A0A1W6R6L4_9CHLO|nr:RlsE [Yamagishiella unicocca]